MMILIIVIALFFLAEQNLIIILPMIFKILKYSYLTIYLYDQEPKIWNQNL